MSNGENESNEADKPKEKTVAELGVDKLDDFLDNYEKGVGLPKMGETDISRYLNLTSEQLNKMTAEECAEGAYLLNQEALYVQREINKYQAHMGWANSRIMRAIAGDIENHGGRYAKDDARRVLAIKGNSAAQDLQKIVDKAERIISRLSYVPNHLTKLANTLLDYRFTKTGLSKAPTNKDI